MQAGKERKKKKKGHTGLGVYVPNYRPLLLSSSPPLSSIPHSILNPQILLPPFLTITFPDKQGAVGVRKDETQVGPIDVWLSPRRVMGGVAYFVFPCLVHARACAEKAHRVHT